MTYQYHPFHIVKPRFLPFLFRLGTVSFVITILEFVTDTFMPFYEEGVYSYFDIFIIGSSSLGYFYVTYLWIDACCYEGAWYGCHTWYAQVIFRTGWFAFVLTEIMIFFSIFWALFYYSLRPTDITGFTFIPSDFPLIHPFHLPLLNTGVLLASGVTVTVSHMFFLQSLYKKAGFYLTITFILGNCFLSLQFIEYTLLGYNWQDGVFAGVFFIGTIMHGGHVSGGAGVLFVARWRLTHPGWSTLIDWERYSRDLEVLFNTKFRPQDLFEKFKFPSQFTYYSHVNFELGIWYWHFVDVVWLFLYSFLYYWIYYKYTSST